jgi:transglutaminase superfamily protein
MRCAGVPETRLPMSILMLQAFYHLMRFDFYLSRGNFQALYAKVRFYPLGPPRAASDSTRICHAIDLACIWYWKEILCLQRSAATTCLLRKYGSPAQLILAAQQFPFKAHAWVEVEGRVVNDKPYMQEIYGILDRC